MIQEEPRRLRVRVRAHPESWDAVAAELRALLAAQVPSDTRLDVEPWGTEADDPTRKFRPVLSRVTTT